MVEMKVNMNRSSMNLIPTTNKSITVHLRQKEQEKDILMYYILQPYQYFEQDIENKTSVTYTCILYCSKDLYWWNFQIIGKTCGIFSESYKLQSISNILSTYQIQYTYELIIYYANKLNMIFDCIKTIQKCCLLNFPLVPFKIVHCCSKSENSTSSSSGKLLLSNYEY